MSAGKLIFSQLTGWIHPEQFRRCVNRYDGNYKVCNFPCWDQFLAMTFAQVTYRQSLADIEVCLRSRPDQLYRMGFRSAVAHSTSPVPFCSRPDSFFVVTYWSSGLLDG
jgi:hypothetical protein